MTETSSSNSIRAIGIELCMVCTTVSTAASIVGKWQIAAETASGIGCSFMVALVIMPKVPSDPMNKSVKLYPADDFLGPISKKSHVP